MNLLEELQTLIQRLEADAVPYALCGGLAVAAYGFVRATEDVDILAPEAAFPALRLAVTACGFTFENMPMVFSNLTITRFVKLAGKEHLCLDVLHVGPNTEQAWESRQRFDTGFGPFCIVSREGLIQLKRLRNSAVDVQDIAALSQPPSS